MYDDRGRSVRLGPFPETMFGIYAELKVYLVEESDVKEPGTSFAGRIENHIEREVESLSASEFLTKIPRVLEQAGMKHVIEVDENDIVVYSSDQASQQDWDEAFKTALNLESSSKGTNGWWILVSGWNNEFKFRQDVTFKQKHTFAAPSMTLVIRALPAEWARQPEEAFDAWMSRLRTTLHDKGSVKEEENRVRPKFEKYLGDHQQLIKDAFAVRDLSQSLLINFSEIDVESFIKNYSAEQPS
jgi:hypothetical protein